MGRPGAPWKRVVLKVSGEALASEAADEVIDGRIVERLAKEIAAARTEFGTEVAVVIGGGNIWRGTTGSATGMDRATADYMGMLATVINALALRDALEREGQPTRVQTAIGMSELAEPYIRLRAIRHLEKGRVVIFAAGTGNPFFTTDTAGALRAVEIGAEILLKGTHGGVDAVYTADPRLDPNAEQISEMYVLDLLTQPQIRLAISRQPAGSAATKLRWTGFKAEVQKILDDTYVEPRFFPLEFRRELFQKDPICKICSGKIHVFEDSTVDHIQAYSRGGKTTRDNGQLAHRSCNASKSIGPPSERTTM